MNETEAEWFSVNCCTHFLVAIMVIGTIAIRKGLINLNIATNSQVQQLILQNSDASFSDRESN